MIQTSQMRQAFLGCFLLGVAHALAVAFGPQLFWSRKRALSAPTNGLSPWTLAASFLAGFGGSGAALSATDRIGAGATLLAAVVTGALLTGLVGSLSRLLGADRR